MKLSIFLASRKGPCTSYSADNSLMSNANMGVGIHFCLDTQNSSSWLRDHGQLQSRKP